MRTTMCRKFKSYTNFAIYYKHNVTLRLRYLFFTILQCKYFLNQRSNKKMTLNWALNSKANQHSPPAAANQLNKSKKKTINFENRKSTTVRQRLAIFTTKKKQTKNLYHYFSTTCLSVMKIISIKYIHFTISLSPLYCRIHSPCHSLILKVDELKKGSCLLFPAFWRTPLCTSGFSFSKPNFLGTTKSISLTL